MFESILSFFGNADPWLSAGTSIFNTYAQMRSQGEQRSDLAFQAQRASILQAEEDQKVAMAQQEYGAIVSYQIDQMRQGGLMKRQQLAYNMLNSGMGISPTDSAGLFLRHQAYHDEMAARAQEATFTYQRPKPHRGIDEVALKRGLETMRKVLPLIRQLEPF